MLTPTFTLRPSLQSKPPVCVSDQVKVCQYATGDACGACEEQELLELQRSCLYHLVHFPSLVMSFPVGLESRFSSETEIIVGGERGSALLQLDVWMEVFLPILSSVFFRMKDHILGNIIYDKFQLYKRFLDAVELM